MTKNQGGMVHIRREPKSTYIVILVWLVSLYIWISTVVYQIKSGVYSGLAFLIVFLLVSLVLYLAEGLELAATSLLDKDLDQISDSNILSTLNEIKADHDFFFAQRQIFVVATISFISLWAAASFEKLYIYPIGIIENWTVVNIISFLFINIFVLCFCQVAPKQLAIVNAEKFMGQARGLWPVIKCIGLLNIPGPSGMIGRNIGKMFKFTRSNLLPSRSNHYNISALLIGYALEQVAVNVKVFSDGSGEVSRTCLLLYLHGRRGNLFGRSRAGLPEARFMRELNIKAMWKMKAVSDIREYSDALDNIFARMSNGEATSCLSEAGFTEIPHNAECTPIVTSISTPLSEPDWTIRYNRELPEEYNKNYNKIDEIVGVMYTISGKTQPGAFYDEYAVDYWTERTGAACRKMYFKVEPGDSSVTIVPQSCEVSLENESVKLKEEESRINPILNEGGPIWYPVQAATYKFRWRIITPPRVPVVLPTNSGQAAIDRPSTNAAGSLVG